MIKKEVIEEVKKRLVRVYDPLEIYIFGSYAWGSPTEDSDLDLCIVVNEIKGKKHDMLVDGHHVLFGLKIPKDIIHKKNNSWRSGRLRSFGKKRRTIGIFQRFD